MNVNYSKVFLTVMFGIVLTSVSVRASQTDDRIQSSAKDSYVYRTYLKDDSINTASNDGVVTLTGTVSEESHKSLAQETVTNLPGVKSVDNQLVIKGDQPAANSDGWIGTKVKSALFFNRNVSAVNTEVDVTNGVVTLKGHADSQAQKDLTGEYAKDIDGVKSVDNQMTIAEVVNKPEEPKDNKIDDASITAQVKMAFLTHHSTSAFKTGVETNNGVVTLSGNAVNGAAKDMAAKVAGDINGVRNVVNNMTINP
ncbi:MAG: BON domain-containing protein [Candidatus Omnitrophica bacterium]|nr:BON domain-containing protein [Candidatus Omnitrophota bacterium]